MYVENALWESLYKTQFHAWFASAIRDSKKMYIFDIDDTLHPVDSYDIPTQNITNPSHLEIKSAFENYKKQHP